MASFTPLPDASDLRFRAACNDALEPAARPVKPRVLDRLAGNADAWMIWSSIAVDTASPPEAATVRFFSTLTADPRWRTLVIEQVHAERRWSDLTRGAFVGVRDRLVAFWEKATGGPGHPMARATSLILTGGVTLLVSFQLADKKPIEMVVRPVIREASFTVSASSQPIQIALVGPNGLSIPISLRTDAAEVPIRIAASVDARGLQSLDRIATATDRNGDRILTAAQRIDALTAGLNRLNEPRTGVVTGLRTLSDAVDRVHDTATQGVAAARNVESQVQALSERVSSEASGLHRAAGLVVQGPVETTISVTEGTSRPLDFVWLGSQGEIASCMAELGAEAVGKTATLAIRPGQGCPFGKHSERLGRGDVMTVDSRLQFKIVLDRVERPLFGRNRAVLRVIRARGTANGNPS